MRIKSLMKVYIYQTYPSLPYPSCTSRVLFLLPYPHKKVIDYKANSSTAKYVLKACLGKILDFLIDDKKTQNLIMLSIFFLLHDMYNFIYACFIKIISLNRVMIKELWVLLCMYKVLTVYIYLS